MTVTENVEARQDSSSDLSGSQVNAMYEINERTYDDARETEPNNRRDSSNEVNALLPTSNHLQPLDSRPRKSDDGDDERSHDKTVVSEKNLELGITQVSNDPPDGGFRAWMILVASFTINGIIFSIINTYSVIYMQLQTNLQANGETEASSKASLVGSLAIGATFFLSPIASILTDKIGIQMTTFLGGAIASSGMLLSSMVTNKVQLLYLTYSVIYGLGASLAYTPSLVILGHYFKRYLGLVNGIVTMGSSVYTAIMPYVIDKLLENFALEGTLRILASLIAVIMFCALLFKPVTLNPPPNESTKARCFKSKLKEVINVSIWKRKKFVIWASAIPIALFGYFITYVHMKMFVNSTFPEADGNLPITCLAITSGIGRLVFGYIADLPRVNRILLQQISFFSIGVLTMLLSVTTNYITLILIVLCMGLFDGCFVSLLGPIAFDICGQSGATQAIGFLLGMCSIPLTSGPPIAGYIYDRTKSYTIPFLLAGTSPIVGACAMFLVRCVKDDKSGNQVDKKDNSLASPAWQTGKADALSILPSFNEVTGKQERPTDGKELQEIQNGTASVLA